MARICVVDDEFKVRALLRMLLTAEGHDVLEAGNGFEALEVLSRDMVDLLITDIRMEGMNGLELLQQVKEREPSCPVIFITAYATVESAVEALRLGAADYVMKPYEEKDILLAVERALGVRRLMNENLRLRQALEEGDIQEAVFASPAMRIVRDTALKVAASEATVLITGESGVGKEVVARLIHQASPRAKGRFVAVNCAAVTPTLVESELFGHERGAFTGAIGVGKGSWNSLREERSFSTRSGTCPWRCRPSSSGPCKNARSRGWAATRTSRWMCGSCAPPTWIWNEPWPKGAFARTCTTGSMCFP